MVKRGIKFTFMLLAAGMMVFLSVSQSLAFKAVSLGDTELEVYGFLRNNYGYFLEDQDYTLNDDKLATNRTWFRLNVDWQLSDSLRFSAVGQAVYEPEYDIEEGSVSEPDGKEYSEYDDINDVLREVYVDWSPNSNHSFRIGRQIVVWGESLAVRVGDVINPENSRFTFAFANWEDTRIPLWMVKGLHYFDDIASSLEWLFSPNLVGEEYRVNRGAEYAIPAAGELVGQRFGIHPEDRFLPPYAVGNDALGAFPPGSITAGTLARGWLYAGPYAPGTGWVPTEIPHVIHEYPEEDDYRFGFRTSTFAGGYEFGVSYFHTQMYNPAVKRTDIVHEVPGLPFPMRDYLLVHPDVDYIGAYFNKDIAHGLIRAEAVYSPNMTFATFDTTDFDGLVERDHYKYSFTWDLSGALFFDWHKSAPFDLSIEHTGEFLPDNDDIQFAVYGAEAEQWNGAIGGQISTNWLYNIIETRLIANYDIKSKSGFIMPYVKWMPSWKDQVFSAELRYIGLFGENDYEGLGILRQKDMVVLTTQFNF